MSKRGVVMSVLYYIFIYKSNIIVNYQCSQTSIILQKISFFKIYIIVFTYFIQYILQSIITYYNNLHV